MNRNQDCAASRLPLRLRLLLVAFAMWAGEAVAQTYIILSLVGDHVTIVGQGSQVGSHLDQNRREVVPLVESQLDDFAVRVADATIAKVRPGASVITLRASDPKLYALRDSWLDADAIAVRDLLSLVASQIPPSPDSHLLLITPYLDQPELKTDRDFRGSGKVAGLGFYLDSMTRMRSSNTRESAPGFLGVFAHFQLVLVNLQTSAIEAQERVVVGTTYAAADAPDRTPWNALSSSGKTRALASLMKGGIERSLPGMLSSQKP
jgi:hypothetical protein